MAAAVFDPQQFGTAMPLPTISRHHADLYQKDMWRGPVWLNTSWMVAEGFACSSRPDVARSIRDQTLGIMQQWQQELGPIFEFYDDENTVPPPEIARKGKNAPEENPYHQVMHDFGWSAALALDWIVADL